MTRLIGGRRFQPAALSLMVVTFASGWNRVFLHTNPFYTAVGVAALIAAAMFMVAWWANRARWMRWAFLGSTLLWVFIAGTSWTIIHSVASFVSAVAWSILAAGSFWYESTDDEVRRER